MSTVPDYHFVLPMEASFDTVKSHVWIAQSFYIPITSSFLYVMALYLGQHLMKTRTAMVLKPVLFLWNAFLAAFSLMCCLRLLPELFHVLFHLGWNHSLCSFSFYDDSSVSGLWSYLFVLSKLFELVDTLFLVLRKRKVIFLHWFHHCSVLIFTWFLLKDKAAIGRWFMNMNSVVHLLMYTYYAMAALDLKLPRGFALTVTTIQISQMIFGSFVSLQGFTRWIRGEKCDISGTAAISAITIYGIYLMLFLNFFVRAYLLPKRSSKNKSS